MTTKQILNYSHECIHSYEALEKKAALKAWALAARAYLDGNNDLARHYANQIIDRAIAA
tara:strand:- start:275 stop:451 length:177 start_codon:yes stop_codon:yes gene_type:complete